MRDPAFVDAHRTSPKDFTRRRVLTFQAVAAFLLCAWKDGLQTLLDLLFESLAGGPLRAVTKSALSQARQKLKASAFEALNQRLLGSLEAFWPEPRWRGLRPVAADGTCLRLPDWPENRAEFGIQEGQGGQPFVMARALGLFSVGAGRMLKATLAHYEAAEAALLVRLLPTLVEHDLLILDRGFPSTWLFALLRQLRRHFLARIDGAQWPEVQAFAASGLAEQRVERPVGRDARRHAQALGLELPEGSLCFRLVRVELPDGTVEILATSLLDTETYPAAEFADLYHGRWNLEEAIKLIKHRLNIEQFSGELPESIRQDFHAKILTANLAWAFAHSAKDTLPPKKAARYRPNLAYVLAQLRLRLFCWLLKRASPDDVIAILELVGKTLELKRPKSPSRPKPRRQYK